MRGTLPHLAFRTLFFSKQRFLKLLNLVTISGIAFSIFALILVTSIMFGFREELNKRWISFHSHLAVTHLSDEQETAALLEKLKTVEEIDEAVLFVEGEVIAEIKRWKEESPAVAKVKGVSAIPKKFRESALIEPEFAEGDEKNFFLGGSGLLSTLGVDPLSGETITLVYPFGEVGPTGDWVPRRESFRLTHLFETGLYTWDAFVVMIPYDRALSLLGEQGERRVQIWLKNFSDLAAARKKIAPLLPKEARLVTFAEENQKLFAALRLERVAMTSLLILFLIVASFSIGSLLLMVLFGRRKDLAVLRAIGLSPKEARRLYLMLGGWLGALGTFFGAALGGIACFLLKVFPFPLPETYYLEFLPVKINIFLIGGLIGLGLFLALLASWIPASMAAKMKLLPVLREE